LEGTTMEQSISEAVAEKARELLVLAETVEAPSVLEYEAAVAIRCGDILAEVRRLQTIVGLRRAQSVRFLLGQGLSYAAVGAACGISRQRAEQIAKK
jgi:hypothetical protein